MLIENKNPTSWQDLQDGVARIFKEIGLAAEVGKTLETPRGNVEVDVYAVDENSVDKIKYVVECKNWNTSIPQTVVHSFTTVIQEIGANIGFIVSKKGLQSGAKKYTQNTNILGLTYEEFQTRYFRVWHEKWFVPRIGDIVDPLSQYVEPFNSYRDKKIDKLPQHKQEQYVELVKKYGSFGITMAFFEFPRYSNAFALEAPDDIEKVKKTIEDSLGGAYQFKAIYMRDLLEEILIR